MRKITFNKNQIVELYSVESIEFVKCHECPYIKAHEKGEEISYIFPRLWRKKKYYEEDVYRLLWGFDTFVTKEEFNKSIRETIDFDIYHIFEKDGTFYRKPFVKIILTNGTEHRIYFDTVNECDEYISKIEKEFNNLITINVDC